MHCNTSWWVKRWCEGNFGWQELKERVLNYWLLQRCGCCTLALFPNLELRRHGGEIIVIVRGTTPCWICHEAKTHQSTRGDVTLNVTFNRKISRKLRCSRLQFKCIITTVSASSAVCCRNCSSNCLRINPWMVLSGTCLTITSPLSERCPVQVKSFDLCGHIVMADDGQLKWYPGSYWRSSWALRPGN